MPTTHAVVYRFASIHTANFAHKSPTHTAHIKHTHTLPINVLEKVIIEHAFLYIKRPREEGGFAEDREQKQPRAKAGANVTQIRLCSCVCMFVNTKTTHTSIFICFAKVITQIRLKMFEHKYHIILFKDKICS